ncbi:MAG: phosphoribosylglycinamide formyltransferase [Acidobacteria bacterium]|nr:phosphoribosylglycinamide formyltransferase [Acidobacteriota bacterium]MBU1473527.1 phosphoribosylglycinamide formyltransferase [Acidobacteriota bacterium]MCG2815098.1 phosphoribosylglycinamide formyltransferase [Candidatus Aminicenantes bacterium]
MTETSYRSPKKRGRIAVFLSGRGSNFIAIHDAILRGDINADIAVVFSNKQNAAGLTVAQERNLEAASLNHKDFEGREAFDTAVVKEMKARDIDLICLAGYMRILTPLICRTFENRLMNIHPALLPSFPGLHVQQMAVDWGVRFSGATVHFVVPDVDMGPIITQAVVPVLQDDTEETLSARILIEEHKIYPEAVKLYFEGRLEVRGRRVFILD